MTRTEERLTDALAARAAAVTAGSIRPLPAPYIARFRRHLTGRRWSASLAPIAAAASIAAISAIVMLPQHHEPGRALAGMPKHSSLLGVAAVSASDAWAVGLVISGRRSLPLIMHWNGAHWTRSPITDDVTNQFLWGVAATSSRDAWAVGAGDAGPSILHWNGSTWAPTPTPRLTASAELSAVTAVSATDAWAVGTANGALILHWNGTRWRIARNPLLHGHGPMALYGVSALSADDVWAVGKEGSDSLILHWNGVSWTRLAEPKYGRFGPISSVVAVSPRLTWLVGAKDRLPLILRWNGSTLRQMPRLKPTSGALIGLGAVSAGQAWAVGASYSHSGTSRASIFRWQGHAWRQVPSPARRISGVLRGVFALSARNAWAVGFTGFAIGTRSRGFILHWNGTTWRAVA